MALLALPKSTTTEQAVHSVSLILHSKLAMESFSLEKENYIVFQDLKENVKKNFAYTIKNRIAEFSEQVRRNTKGIKALLPSVNILILINLDES